MFYKLKEIIFGLNEFEKTKIDYRFNLLSQILENLQISQLNDFEIIEECISKIKDLLRVKSSNLNKIISDPKRQLTKKDVNQLIDKLNYIKYDFLKKAFSIVEEKNTNNNDLTLNSANNNFNFKQYSNQIKDLDSNKIKSNIKTDNDKNNNEHNNDINNQLKNINNKEKTANIIIKENQYCKIYLQNGKIPHLLINFKNIVDFSLIKQISSIFYEQYKAQGTNIIIENKRVLIIPRFENDNLFKIQRIDLNLDDIFNKIKLNINKEEYMESQNISIKENQDNEKRSEENYIEYDNTPKTYNTKKYAEDSLDSLLLKNNKPDFSKNTNFQNDNSKIIIQKGENNIEIEREQETNNNEVEILQSTKKDTTQNKKHILQNNIDQNNKSNQNNSKRQNNNNNRKYKHLIYQDENIVVYLKENSKALGEMIIKSNKEDLVENNLSYMMIFSKIFSSILFEQLKAHGTNLIVDYKNKLIRIIPRYQDDKLNINWQPKEESDRFLEDIKKKLIDKLNGINNPETSNPQEEDINLNQKKEEKIELTDDEKSKKARYILDQIRKIP
ncbi:MAG: hypothetical protein ACOC16_03770 [Nanoarchaeota archaeon]